jgi:murein DD-endopeptidase MepM/ murein hydrolase activator NlpD
MRQVKKRRDKAMMTNRITAGTALVFLLAMMTHFVARAEDSLDSLTAEQRKALEDREDELDDIKAKIKAYKDIVNLKQRQGAALGDQIESLEAQAKSLELQMDLNQKTLVEIQSEVQILTERIRQKEAVIIHQKGILSEIMRGYYDDQASVIPAELIMNASQMVNPLQEGEWTAETGAKMSELLSSLRSLRESLVSEHQALIEKQKKADTLRLQLEEQDARLDSTKTNKEQLLAKTQSEVQKYDALVDDLEKQREEIEDEIESLEAGKIDALDTKDLPGFNKGTLSYPVRKVTITQSYGKTSFAKKSGFYKSGFHNGIDFGIPIGTSILAAADGKVIAIGNNGKYAYGRYVAIDHGNGLVTMYGHLSSVTRKLGEKVKRGDTIAKSGNTGNSTGPHLHFTVFSAKSFDVVASKVVKSLKDIPVGATVNPKVYLP